MREERRNGTAPQSLSDLVKQAATKTVEFESNEEFVSTEREKLGSGKAVEGSLKAYYKEFRKVRSGGMHRVSLPYYVV